MRKKLMKTICTFLACILLLNSTVLAVPVENTSAQSTFSSTLTREPISKITDGEIQSSDIEIVKRDVEGTQLLVNCKGVQWYLTYDIESRIAESKICQQMNHMISLSIITTMTMLPIKLLTKFIISEIHQIYLKISMQIVST